MSIKSYIAEITPREALASQSACSILFKSTILDVSDTMSL